MSGLLQTILAHKRQEIALAKARVPYAVLEAAGKTALPPRGFLKALQAKQAEGEPAIIAEIKKASPSKGVIRENFNPAELARAFEQGGAACLSVLTDEKFFQGAHEHLQQARAVASLPVLRKDFLCDPYQVVESRSLGADCILVILAAIDDACARDLQQTAQALRMDVLIEVHNEDEMHRALGLNAQLIGINNRNLEDFSVDLTVSERLSRLVTGDTHLVAESGIASRFDIKRLKNYGISSFLVGESLMAQEDPSKALKELLI